MYSVNPPLIFVFFLLYFSFSDATIANNDPPKYTVGFKIDGHPYRCLAGILGERTLISAVDCFTDRHTESNVDSKLLTAVIGSVEVPVDKIDLLDVLPRVGSRFHDYALIRLKERLNLEENGLTKLDLPVKRTEVNSSVVVSRSDGSRHEIGKITDSKNCPRGDGKVNYIPESHLCVELPNSSKGCSDADLGAPLVVRGDHGINRVIGVHLKCYDNLAYEAFANLIPTKKIKSLKSYQPKLNNEHQTIRIYNNVN